jgi:hypothetical protein
VPINDSTATNVNAIAQARRCRERPSFPIARMLFSFTPEILYASTRQHGCACSLSAES